MKNDFMFTSESVTEGHPDKLCDLISDALVDHFLQQDPDSSVIAECAVSTSVVFIAARFASEATVDFPKIARQVISQVGYDQQDFNSKTCSIITSIKELPADGYYSSDERTMTDFEIERVPVRNQATVFGFACDQTPALMPLPIWLAHKLARRLTSVRLQKLLPYLAPDGKTQIGVEFREGRPRRIHSITVLASQDKSCADLGLDRFRDEVIEAVIRPVFHDEEVAPDARTRVFINPDGPFITGGAALSGKDPLRIDRVGAYAARYAAKNVVAAGLARECEVQISYSIGLSRPVSIQVETFGTGVLSDSEIAALVEKNFDFRIAGIIKQFNLKHLPSIIKGGFYRKLAAYGHVGRMDIGLPWETTDRAHTLK